MEEKIIMMFKHNGKTVDIEVPKNITANELIFGLNSGFSLNINLDNPDDCFMRAENPVALITGEKTLEELGLRNGTMVIFEQ